MRKFFAILLCIILFSTGAFASFAGSYTLLRTPETLIDSSYLMRFTDGDEAYYLQKAAPDIVFYINSNNTNYTSLFTLIDSEGNEMPQRIEKDNKVAFKILPPENGYKAGKQYSLFLNDGATFSGNDLKDVKELVFSVEKEAVEAYEYTDYVSIANNVELATVEGNIVELKGLNATVGDILIDEMASEAYKVVEILDDGTAIVVTPAFDEIFSDLQVYGEYTWDIDDIEWNSDLEFEIEQNLRQSSFFDSLMSVAYAAEADDDEKFAGVKVKFEPNPSDNTVKTEIKITLGPGKNGLFGISKLKNQEVTITLVTVTGFSLYCNIDGPIWNPAFDISATQTNEFSWTVSFEVVSGTPIKNEINAATEIKNLAEYQNIVGDLTKKLANVVKDKESGEVRLFKWTLPVPAIPLLSFDAEIVLFTELELAAQLTLGGHSATRSTAGLRFKDGHFRTYSDEYRSKSPINLTLIGKGELKAGVKLEIRAKIISEKVAYLQIDPQAGIYSDVFITYPVSKPEDMSDAGSILGLYGYFEGGLYFGVDFKAAVNLVFGWIEYERELAEIKAPLITLGNKKIAVGISPSRSTVRALNNSVTAPDIIFEYYDVTKGRMDSETVSTENVKFSANNQELEVLRNELKLPAAGVSSFYVNASYKNKGDNRSYSTLFKVIVSGSEIEGRVSAYTSDSNYEAISNATVDLYGANDLNAKITSAKTDENGKFFFSISDGKYVLQISAQGYKELTSIQEIAKDETKYTEHILLVDSAQSGNGTAGGRVNNAIDGRNLEGVEIRLRGNWNNREGEYFREFQTFTNTSGQYRVESIPVGYYTVEASKDGFYTDYCNIIVHASDPQYDQNFTISPMLPEDQIRIVLRWDEHPRDIDSHLIGYKPDGSGFNVFFSNMRYSWNGTEMANLDVDDTTSYGPETVTILQPLDDWVYAVHDYTNKGSSSSDRMSYSGAYVTVFTGGRQIATFNIPVGEVGTYWTVFEYIDGQIRPINAVNNTIPMP